jgi:PKD domain
MRGRAGARSGALGACLRVTSAAVLGVIASSVLLVASSASAIPASPRGPVSVVPAAGTPDVNDGTVFAIAAVGTQIILGGTFTSVSPPDDPNTVYPLQNTFAFDASTGAIDHTGFLPAVNGEVDAVIPGPHPSEVYIGGMFTTVDGKAMRVALLNTTTGGLVSSWNPSSINGTVTKLVVADHKLFVGGLFTSVGGVTHRGLVALKPDTGKLTKYVDLSFVGHHNYGTKCDPTTSSCAPGLQGVKSFDINAAGTSLIAIGNFTSVSRSARDQIAMINLGKSAATVDRHWATLAYTAACFAQAFDSDVRDVKFSPGGAYFVVVATGGIGTNRDGTNSSCDSAARFETNSTGKDVRPTWIDYTGEDTLLSVAITGGVVYVGGHQRWVNNSFGQNVAGAGAIPRPGIAALSPVSGLPFTWNPGRNPRGAGCYALLATSHGLWTGGDTDYIGNRTYLRPKVAFFPIVPGEKLAAQPTPTLPGRVYLAGATAPGASDPDRFGYREFGGKGAGAEMPLTTGIAWGSVDGAFTVDGEVIYGKSDGNLYERSFDGTTFGPEVELDPFNDPTWDNVKTGSGQTYQGLPSTFSSEIPSVTSMFFKAGRLYYTMAGDHAMHWRWFEPESGVIGADEFTVSGHMDWSGVSGAFLAGKTLYYADQTGGELWAVGWSGERAKGTPKRVDRSTDWASRGLFLLSSTTNPTPVPAAAFTARCGASARCRFAASPWADPDGGVVKYKWNFGDGRTSAWTRSTTASHRYTTDGTRHVRLTVIDTAGARASSTRPLTVRAPIEKVEFVGASKVSGTGNRAHLRVPRAASAGNALMLFESYASTSARAKLPSRWRLVGRTRRHSLTTAVYDEVARKHHVPKSVTVKYSHAVHSSLILAVYRHTAAKPIERSAVAVGTATRMHRAPALRHLSAGSWVVGYWTQTSRWAATWKSPHALKKRVVVRGPPRPADGAVLADTGTPRRGTCRLGSARTNKAGRSAAQWAVALAPALG